MEGLPIINMSIYHSDKDHITGRLSSACSIATKISRSRRPCLQKAFALAVDQKSGRESTTHIIQCMNVTEPDIYCTLIPIQYLPSTLSECPLPKYRDEDVRASHVAWNGPIGVSAARPGLAQRHKSLIRRNPKSQLRSLYHFTPCWTPVKWTST